MESPTFTVLEEADPSLLELVDHVLNKGVVLSGEVTLGLAGIDLIYVRLLALICAADRVSGGERIRPRKSRNRRSTIDDRRSIDRSSIAKS